MQNLQAAVEGQEAAQLAAAAAGENPAQATGRAYVLQRAALAEQAVLAEDSARLAGIVDGAVEAGPALDFDGDDAVSAIFGSHSSDTGSERSSIGDLAEERDARALRRAAMAAERHAPAELLYVHELPAAEALPPLAGEADVAALSADEQMRAPSQPREEEDPEGAAVNLSSDSEHEIVQPAYFNVQSAEQALLLSPETEIAKNTEHESGIVLYASAFHELMNSPKTAPPGWLSDRTMNWAVAVVQVCCCTLRAVNTMFQPVFLKGCVAHPRAAQASPDHVCRWRWRPSR